MSPRPTIFISAVSKELKSARQLVSNTLQFLGYEPVWQDIFGTEQGDLRAMLRQKVDSSKGVVQLVGECYGAEPRVADEQFGRVSYTQYEALYARQRGKKVWFLFLDDSFPVDAHEAESGELRELQAAYRRRLKSESLLYHPLSNREALEASVLKLRNDIEVFKRRWKIWAAAVIVLLVLLGGSVTWMAVKLERMGKVLTQALATQPGIQNDIHQEQPKGAVSDEDVYNRLGKQFGVDPKTLEKELPAFAQKLKSTPNATSYERAGAAFVTKDYAEAERLALAAADEAQKAVPPNTPDAIKAFQLAGYAADSRTNDVARKYADALGHYRSAQQLTGRARDPLLWAGLQRNIAFVLDEQGQYADAEKACRDALEEFQRGRPGENKGVLALRNNLAIALSEQGKYADAEGELRKVVATETKSLDPKDPVTLLSQMNLANVLLYQGKYPDAEAEYGNVIKAETDVFGPMHSYTLASRNNLAVSLLEEGKYAEAETELREVTALETTKLGPEHRNTLSSRDTLALALLGGEKSAEAEQESRTVVALREKVLGLNHPDTINSRNNLAHALNEEGKYAEAEALSREIINLDETTLGLKHPYRIEGHHNLAVALGGQGKFDEAETEFWETINLREKVLGPAHPNTLCTDYRFALCLKAENKPDEAKKFARRAVDGAAKVLGTAHPDTRKYEKLLQELP